MFLSACLDAYLDLRRGSLGVCDGLGCEYNGFREFDNGFSHYLSSLLQAGNGVG